MSDGSPDSNRLLRRWTVEPAGLHVRPVAAFLALAAAGLSLSGVLSHHHAWDWIGAALGAASALLWPGPPGWLGRSRPWVGMGVGVGSGVQLGPGACVEMGCTIGADAVLEEGALVRMGAHLGRGARVCAYATVWWGASVGSGAVLEPGASVGPGAVVARGARVPAGVFVAPGTTWQAGSRAAPVEPEARLMAACQQLEGELSQTAPRLRGLLPDAGQLTASLRQQGQAWVQRERSLRALADVDTARALSLEKGKLQSQRASHGDGHVQRSLDAALLALEEQGQQHTALLRHADRAGAELTRLILTLEGLTARLARLRMTGEETLPARSLEADVQELRDRVEAVTRALEDVQAEDRGDVLQPTRSR